MWQNYSDMFNILVKISLFSKTLFIFLYIPPKKAQAVLISKKYEAFVLTNPFFFLNNVKSLYYTYMYLCNSLDLQK